MLPFVIKDTHQPVERLRRITAQNQHQDLDVHVELLLHTREIRQVHALSGAARRHLSAEIFNEAKARAYEEFLTFLRRVAEPEVFLPTDLLNRYPHRQYYLLLSPNRSHELFEIYNTELRYGQRLVTYVDYDFIVEASPQIIDREAYLIAPGKYTLFMRQVNEDNAIRVYRSDFVDLAASTPPPLDLRAQDLINTIQNGAEATTEDEPHWQQLLMFPTAQEKEEPPTKLTKCPACEGQVQEIGEDSYFCLNCDWDNLKTLR